MARAAKRILLVDDYKVWREFASKMLEQETKLQVVAEAADGLQAVQLAHQLEPELILLDVGLPGMNGIETARQIRQVSPNSEILFLSENQSEDIAEAALSTGARGYVVKSAALRELLPAVEAVLQHRKFVSAIFRCHNLPDVVRNVSDIPSQKPTPRDGDFLMDDD